MDKALFRAYIKELVKEQLEETVEKTVRKVLPDILGEAVAEIKSVNEAKTPVKSKFNRSQLAEMMGLERLGDTLSANTDRMKTSTTPIEIPDNLSPDDPTVKAVTRDYSELMKKMGLSK